MFELSSFIVKNTVNGVKNGTFSKEYVNIMAVNYMLKGVLAEEDVISISTQIESWEAEQAAGLSPADPSEEIPVEDVLTETQEEILADSESVEEEYDTDLPEGATEDTGEDVAEETVEEVTEEPAEESGESAEESAETTE